MSKKYGFYKLTKVSGKKEYTPSVMYTTCSLSGAYEELQSYWDDCLDQPVWFNKKIGEMVAYEQYDRMLAVPNDKEVNGYIKTIGLHGNFPIYYIDVYPNPYSRYKLKRKNGEFILEGIVSEEA